MKIAGFDWDVGNREKCQKHGVTLQEIEEVMRSESLKIAPDIKHSNLEKRYMGIGQNEAQRYVFLIFTLRIRDSDLLIRPISARYMHDKEIEHYKSYEKE